VACPLVRSSTLHPKRELSSTIVRQERSPLMEVGSGPTRSTCTLSSRAWSPCARRGVWLRLGLTLNARQTGREGLRRSVVGGWETLHGLKMNQASKRGLPQMPKTTMEQLGRVQAWHLQHTRKLRAWPACRNEPHRALLSRAGSAMSLRLFPGSCTQHELGALEIQSPHPGVASLVLMPSYGGSHGSVDHEAPLRVGLDR